MLTSTNIDEHRSGIDAGGVREPQTPHPKCKCMLTSDAFALMRTPNRILSQSRLVCGWARASGATRRDVCQPEFLGIQNNLGRVG